MTEYALRLANGQDTMPRMRAGDALDLVPGAAGVNQARAGLRHDGGGEVTVVAGTMTVEVSPFMAWVDGDTSDAQGGYPFILDAPKQLALTAGDATLDRVDTIVARVQDDAYDGGGVTTATVEVVEGTPGGGAPVLPLTCVPLRDVTVPFGASAGTGGLTASDLGADRRRYFSSLGGVVPVVDIADRDSLDARDGQLVYRLDNDALELRRGGEWRPLATYSDPVDVPATHPDFTGSLTFIKVGQLVTVTSYLDVDVNTGGGFVDTGVRIPANMLPIADQLCPFQSYNSTNQYRYRFGMDGVVEFQHTGADGTFESVQASWVTNG